MINDLACGTLLCRRNTAGLFALRPLLQQVVASAILVTLDTVVLRPVTSKTPLELTLSTAYQ